MAKKKNMLGGCIFLSTGHLGWQIKRWLAKKKGSIQMQMFLSLFGHLCFGLYVRKDRDSAFGKLLATYVPYMKKMWCNTAVKHQQNVLKGSDLALAYIYRGSIRLNIKLLAFMQLFIRLRSEEFADHSILLMLTFCTTTWLFLENELINIDNRFTIMYTCICHIKISIDFGPDDFQGQHTRLIWEYSF